jgi:hypothetical protein
MKRLYRSLVSKDLLTMEFLCSASVRRPSSYCCISVMLHCGNRAVTLVSNLGRDFIHSYDTKKCGEREKVGDGSDLDDGPKAEIGRDDGRRGGPYH